MTDDTKMADPRNENKCASSSSCGCDSAKVRQVWLHVKLLYAALTVMILGYTVSMMLIYLHLNRLLEEGAINYYSNFAGSKLDDRNSDNRQNYSDFQNSDKSTILPEKENSALLHSHWKRNVDRISNGKQYYRPKETEAGNAYKEEWVWMSSFSRIPTTTLQNFCAATKDYCPKGFPGPPGMKGQKGDSGNPGKDGHTGDIGPQGFVGPPGEKGEPGLEGIQGPVGPPGLKGEKGDQGEAGLNGTEGQMGRRGIQGSSGEPGLPGLKGDKGDRGEPLIVDQFLSNCSCPPGMKGSKGDPGYVNTADVNTDSLVGWIDIPVEITTTEAPEIIVTTPEPTIVPRKESCKIRLVNKPEFKRHTDRAHWGSWFKDTSPPNGNAEKIWLTKHYLDGTLYEYANFEDFRKDRVSQMYDLKDPFYGTEHFVYKGHFFYHKSGSNEIARYSLKEDKVTATLSLTGAAFNAGSYLYSADHNYFDLSVDENGLWIIYAMDSMPDLLLVSKLNDSLSIDKQWNISVARKNYGNGFIACGILYLVRDTRTKTTMIDFAYDLYTKQNLSVRLKFTNPFQMNNMISYNALEKRLYSWDKGHQLIYPLTI